MIEHKEKIKDDFGTWNMELKQGWVKKLNDTKKVMSEIKLHIFLPLSENMGLNEQKGFFPLFQ